jgi:tetratricopeptide (TPR) repeat protein
MTHCLIETCGGVAVNANPKKARDVFLAASKLPAEEREAYLQQACGEDQDLHQRIFVLLQAQAEIGSFHEAPALTVDQPISESPGTVIGPYKLLEPIGEGGMGAVWMAQQQEPVKRLVAVKVVKAGMDSRQVIARFEAERQALALMDHANIARVLDGGTNSAGRPYFVMDLVKGVPITRYCDEHHLTPRQRLELFVPVCSAIQHAHQKGVIHRDLKPSNVLVALYDGRPVPKVIDFGVAKAAGQSLTDKTLVTGFGAIVGTLEYMSPEQAEINQLDIDTRSDIYSLGVLLYELLAGSPPFTRKEWEKVGLLEMLRVIREEEPTKPSAKLSTAEGLPTLAANRGTEPAKLTRLVRGELDWIVMKALEKDRNRRYETANGFAMDVQRYLTDEPVLACPPSAAYRLRKFARRNKAGLAVAALVLFFLVLLGSGVGWAWRDRAARAAEQANHLERAVERAEFLQREGKRGEALAALERAQLLAREAEPAPGLAGRIESLQQLLDAEERDEVFVAQFEAIRREVQTEYDVEKHAFSPRKGVPRVRAALEQYGITLGVTPPAAAVAHIQTRPVAIRTVVVVALEECLCFGAREDTGTRQWLRDVLLKADDDPWRNKVRRAFSQPPATLEALAKDIDVRQQPPSYLVLVVSALPRKSPSRLDLLRRVQFAYPGDFWVNLLLGDELLHTEKDAEAIRYYTAALAIRPDNPGVLLNRALALGHLGKEGAAAARADLQRAITVSPRLARAHFVLGSHLCADLNDYDKGIECLRKAIEFDPKHADAHHNLGAALASQGKLDEAIAVFRKAVELDPKKAILHYHFGKALSRQGKWDAAVAAYRKAIERDLKHTDAHYALGVVLCDELRDYENAAACFRKVIELDPKHADAHSSLGSALRDQGRLDEAITAYHKAIALDPKHANAYRNLGVALSRQGKVDDAIAACRKATLLDPKDASAHYSLGVILCDVRRDYENAAACFRKVIELDPKMANAYCSLGIALRRQKKLDEAIAACRKAIALDPKHANAYRNLGVALHGHKKLAEAIAAYRKATLLDPKKATLHYNLGSALRDHKKLDEAIACYRKAIELDPKKSDFHCNLGNALRAKGLVDEAIAAYRKAIELDPKHAIAHNNLGAILCDVRRDYENAAACFRKAIELDPKKANSYSSLGRALHGQKKLDEAIAACRKALEIDPKHAGATHGLAVCAWALATHAEPARRDPGRAVKLARETVEIAPNSYVSWLYLGWIHYRTGNWKSSIEALEKSCKLQMGGTGDAGQWIVLALAHARLAAQEGLPEKEREHHKAEARRRYEEADKQIDSWYRARPDHDFGQTIWDFRAEGRELMAPKESKK